MKGSIIFAIVLLLAGCMSFDSSRLEWRRDDIVDHDFSLVDEKRVEWYSFGAEGGALMGIGEAGGPQAPLACQWKIEAGDLYTFGSGWHDRRLTLIKRSDTEYTVRTRWGRTLVFKVTKKAPEPIKSSTAQRP